MKIIRREDISIAKAFGIILMVVGHSGCPQIINSFIYQFHMPLFFIMAGICLKEENIRNLSNFFKKKMKGIWWPYVKYGVLFLLFHNVFYHLNIYSSNYGFMNKVSSLYSTSDFLWNFTKIIRMTGSEQLLGGFWFLHELFWASIISVISIRIIKNKYVVLFILIFIAFIMNYKSIEIPIIQISSITFLSASFFIIGYCFKNVKIKNIIFPFAFIAIVLGVKWGASSMHITDSHMIFPYIIVATLGTFSVYKFSVWLIEKSSKSSIYIKYISFIGNNTLYIFIWHFLSFKIVSLIIIIIYDLPIEMLSKFPIIDEYSLKGFWILYTFVGVTLPLLLQQLILLVKVSLINVREKSLIE